MKKDFQTAVYKGSKAVNLPSRDNRNVLGKEFKSKLQKTARGKIKYESEELALEQKSDLRFRSFADKVFNTSCV